MLDGLVLLVGFGDCWKDSLSELTGGQRSLLVLSLILLLLLFKPAPMYILDEIDAALDLSHTEKIGNMCLLLGLLFILSRGLCSIMCARAFVIGEAFHVPSGL